MNAVHNNAINAASRHRLDKQIVSVAALLAEPDIAIPDYQRPYKWTTQHLNQLVNDVKLFSNKPSYRLGTVVLHTHDEQLDIVDGQQRFLSLLLLVKAISEMPEKVASPELDQQLQQLAHSINAFADKQHFASTLSAEHLATNFLEAKRIVARPDFTEQHIQFLLNGCELITVVLDDISEAFQFFDSQNARGRDLAPHDLLKAYHLREFSEESLKQQTVSAWEARESKELERLFAVYLYRIRRWSEGLPALQFTKRDIDTFKGVSLHKLPLPPFAKSLQLLESNTDNVYPFQLNQTIPNGRRFFEYVAHYLDQQADLSKQIALTQQLHDSSTACVEFFGTVLSPLASKILITINSYKERHRSGDVYVRNVFDCALLMYIDKFGTLEISNAIEKLFIWAYRLRLTQQLVKLISADNYAKDSLVFKRLRLATNTSEILLLPISPIEAEEASGVNRNKSTSLMELVALFKELQYYHD